jgi:hypothetical protein
MGEIHGSVAGSTYNPLTAGASSTYGNAPDAYGSLEWNFPPVLAGRALSAMVTGTIYGAKMPWRQPATQALTSVQFNVNTAGATLSGSQVAIFDLAGNIVSTAAAADTQFTGTNYQAVPLSISGALMSAAATVGSGYVYAAFLPVGTTGPILLGFPNATNNQIQWGASGNKLVFCILGNLSAQASIPSTINLSNNAANGFDFACGFK